MKQIDKVTIELVEAVPDVLQRVALLNAALFRVLSGVTLVKVLDADYEEGHIHLLATSRHVKPNVVGRVCVKYEPAS